jgi:hypothetical protein
MGQRISATSLSFEMGPDRGGRPRKKYPAMIVRKPIVPASKTFNNLFSIWREMIVTIRALSR